MNELFTSYTESQQPFQWCWNSKRVRLLIEIWQWRLLDVGLQFRMHGAFMQ